MTDPIVAVPRRPNVTISWQQRQRLYDLRQPDQHYLTMLAQDDDDDESQAAAKATEKSDSPGAA